MLTLFIVKERAIWVMPLANASMPLFVIEILSIESVFKLYATHLQLFIFPLTSLA